MSKKKERDYTDANVDYQSWAVTVKSHGRRVIVLTLMLWHFKGYNRKTPYMVEGYVSAPVSSGVQTIHRTEKAARARMGRIEGSLKSHIRRGRSPLKWKVPLRGA